MSTFTETVYRLGEALFRWVGKAATYFNNHEGHWWIVGVVCLALFLFLFTKILHWIDS